MRIRGLGTLSNGEVSNPLIVVDGVPMDDISFLDTQDIENISVLRTLPLPPFMERAPLSV